MRDHHRPDTLLARVDWGVLTVIILSHVALIAVPMTFSWGALGCALLFHWVTGCLGITLGFHRVLTHRALRVPRALEAFLAVCGCLALQGDPIRWVAIHRKHHAHADREGDPHSPRESFWWSYLGWMVLTDEDAPTEILARRYAPDVAADPMYRFMQRTQVFYSLLLAVGLYLWGGWGYVVWGIALRAVVLWHGSWLVSSACHLWGYRNAPTKDHSTNLWWLAILTYGEGWHNNHHGEPRAASLHVRWWEFDATWVTIRALEILGLARDVRRRGRVTRPVRSVIWEPRCGASVE